MKQDTLTTINNNLANVLRMQAGVNVQCQNDLEHNQAILEGLIKQHDKLALSKNPDMEKLDQINLLLGMQREVIAQYRLALMD